MKRLAEQQQCLSVAEPYSTRKPYAQKSGTARWSLRGRKRASVVGDRAGEVQLKVSGPEHSNKNICTERLLVQGVRTQEEGLP